MLLVYSANILFFLLLQNYNLSGCCSFRQQGGDHRGESGILERKHGGGKEAEASYGRGQLQGSQRWKFLKPSNK